MRKEGLFTSSLLTFLLTRENQQVREAKDNLKLTETGFESGTHKGQPTDPPYDGSEENF